MSRLICSHDRFKCNPAGTLRQNNVVLTAMHYDVASTLMRTCFKVDESRHYRKSDFGYGSKNAQTSPGVRMVCPVPHLIHYHVSKHHY